MTIHDILVYELGMTEKEAEEIMYQIDEED